MILVPVLAGITNRMDARKIIGLGMVLGVLTALGRFYLEPNPDRVSDQPDRVAGQHRRQ